MLVRLDYLAVSNAFTALRFLPMGDRDKDIEILALRHHISVLQRQLRASRPRFEPADRALPAALLAPLPRDTLRRLRPLVRPDTVLRWHRSAGATPNAADENTPASRAPSPRSADESRTWHTRPHLGLPQHPRRAGDTRHQGRRIHGMADPQGHRHRNPGPTARPPPGARSCTARPTRSWRTTSSRQSP